MIDNRIKEYKYLEQLQDYIKTAEKQHIETEKESFIFPKQLEIHLPSDRNKNCNLSCGHCFSTKYRKSLGNWESIGLELLYKLKGAIPFSIFGGAYTEPTASFFLFPYLDAVKKYNNHFGLHTNGTYLYNLEKNQRFLKNVNSISTDKRDYISISIDAGSGDSWEKLKRQNKKSFWDIIKAIEMMANYREKNNTHAIRIVYLASELTANVKEFEFIVSIAELYKLDSVRFSVPYGYYNLDFDKVKQYRDTKEKELAYKVETETAHLVSKNKDEIPYIFYNPPYFTDIERFTFKECFYGFFQITLGADGFVYPCSAVAAPTAEKLRLGKITADLEIFKKQCWEIQHNKIQCKDQCFNQGLRCNRMGLEINEYFNRGK